jgi:hypothetical protein
MNGTTKAAVDGGGVIAVGMVCNPDLRGRVQRLRGQGRRTNPSQHVARCRGSGNYHLVGVLGQQKWGFVKYLVSIFSIFVRCTVINGTGYFAH